MTTTGRSLPRTFQLKPCPGWEQIDLSQWTELSDGDDLFAAFKKAALAYATEALRVSVAHWRPTIFFVHEFQDPTEGEPEDWLDVRVCLPIGFEGMDNPAWDFSLKAAVDAMVEDNTGQDREAARVNRTAAKLAESLRAQADRLDAFVKENRCHV